MKKTIRYIGGIVTAAALAAAAAWWLSLPAPEDQHRCMAMIEQQRCAQLSVGTLSMPLISNIDDRDTTRPYRNFDTWTPAYTDTEVKCARFAEIKAQEAEEAKRKMEEMERQKEQELNNYFLSIRNDYEKYLQK